MSYATELLKGTNSLMILSILEKEEMYGYQMQQKLASLSEDYFKVSDGTLYPVLHAMEKKELLTSYWKEVSEGGRRRRYYKITDKGIKTLASYKQEWKSHSNAVGKVLGGASYAGA